MISFLLTIRRFFHGFFHAFKKSYFKTLLVLTITILISGTIFYSTVEGFSVLDALYFSVVTLTTVGHPTLGPVTAFGKIFTMLYIMTGLGLIMGFIYTLGSGIVQSKGNDEGE